MHFLRAAIFSIAVLAFTASALVIGSSGRCAALCNSDSDCHGLCFCIVSDGDVSSLLLLARLNLLVITLQVSGVCAALQP